MTLGLGRDGGAYCKTAHAGNGTATAAGTGDATEVDGAYVDRLGGSHGPARSCKLVIAGDATLQAAETLTIAANLQDATSSGGAGVADFGPAMAATVVATGPGGGGNVKFTAELDFNLEIARQFIRAQITPNLSAAGTDTARWQACFVFFDADRNPITRRSN